MLTKPQSRTRILETIAARWNAAGITYAVVHGVDDYPQHIGRDVDVLVTPRDRQRAIELTTTVFHEEGYRVARPDFLWGDLVIGIPVRDGWTNALEVHLLTEFGWRWVPLVRGAESDVQIGPFRAARWAAFAKRVLMPLLSDTVARLEQRPAAVAIATADEPLIRDRLQAVFGDPLADRLLVALRDQQWPVLRELVAPLRRAASHRCWRANPLATAGRVARLLGRRGTVPFHPCAPIVAVVGPDGVGKSTLLQHLTAGDHSFFTHIIVRHWRPDVLPLLGSFCRGGTLAAPGPPRRTPGRGAALRSVYYAMDFIIGYWLKDRVDSSHQGLVVYDRCFLDMLVDPVRYGLSTRRWLDWLRPLIPQPDILILLRDAPERIHARKPELDCDEIARQLAAWAELHLHGRVHAVLENAPPAVLADQVRELIFAAFLRRHQVTR